MRTELTERMESFIVPFIADLSIDLVELKIKKRNKTIVVDIIADKREGSITIDECVLINKQMTQVIKQQRWFGDNFVVEVSSPGLDRPLKTSKDFSRVLGRRVRVHLLQAIEGKVEHHGEITEVHENEVLIQDNDKIIIIPLEYISKAVQVINET